MGVMSRRVLPVCGNLCFFCPAMRARSRQPVKRYKRLLAEIFPRSQEPEPNDRKIGKLCEYASKNPLRIPKITEYLEQKFYKDLRNEHFASVNVVLCVYRKLLSSCKEHMSLFASSLLGLVRTLLEQTRDETRILGCTTLVDFIKCQTESTYMFNIEGLIPKLCQVAQEVGDDTRALRLRSAGLQALAFMVWFMGEHSHISMDFDIIISVTLENYLDHPVNLEKDQLGSTRGENHVSAFPDIGKNIPSLLDMTNSKLELDTNVDVSISPSYWSRVCLYNMARLAKEATTVRRVLEPLFHSFDAENHWSSENGLALSVLKYVQLLLEESGINSHLLLSILVKHLDHKAIVKQPVKQMPIVKIIIQLAQNAKQEASVALIGAISDLLRNLRKCIQFSPEASNSCDGLDTGNSDLQLALEECILQLSNKVGDAGPILDMLAVALENIPSSAIGARPTIISIYRTAQMISFLPNVTYQKKAFPDALFHQLLLAMGHPDHETRVLAHHVFSVVLMPSLLCPWLVHDGGLQRTLPNLSAQDEKLEPVAGFQVAEAKDSSDHDMPESFEIGSRGPSCSFKVAMTNGKMEPSSLRLSSHQVSLLLSAIWVHATSTENTPANFEAMAHTYNICLLFTRNKNSSHMALVRCLQLAFSLRRASLDQEAGLQPSRRRSLFTTASCMLIFSARAGNLPELIPLIKSSLTDVTADPYLNLVEDIRLHVISGSKEKDYGSQEDEVASLKSLSTIHIDDHKLKESVVSLLLTKNANLPEDELSSMRRQILEGFSPDDAYPLGVSLFLETPRPCSPLNQMESLAFDEVTQLDALTDEEAFPEPNGSESGRKTSLSVNSLDVLSVNQLLESVLETARQVASLPVSSTPVPYDQMKNQCEALVTGKQQKMSVLQSFKPPPQDAKAIVVTNERESITSCLSNLKIELSEGELKLTNMEKTRGRDKLLVCSLEYGQQQSFRLPPSSPYDKFLKAAGC